MFGEERADSVRVLLSSLFITLRFSQIALLCIDMNESN